MAKNQKSNPDDPKELVTVSLGTEHGNVRAAAVGATMTAIVTLVEEIQHGIAENEQLLVKARPFAKGSFSIPLEFIVVSGGTLFVASPLLERLFELLASYFEIKVALKGIPPILQKKETLLVDGQEVVIRDVIFSLLSQTSKANIEIAKAMNEIERDPEITDLSIYRGTENKRIVRVVRKQFQYFVQGFEQFDGLSKGATSPRERETRSREELVIRVIAFEGNAKWKFNRKGTIIAAKISDETFMDRVRNRSERFGAGDRLEVELVTSQRFDDVTQDYLDASYEIARVWGHKGITPPLDLFENEKS